jgi:hypothetical protein
MNTANRFNLASNHLQIGDEMINPEEKDEQRLEGAFHKFPSEFSSSDHSRWWLISPTVTTLSCLPKGQYIGKLGRLPGQRQADNKRHSKLRGREFPHHLYLWFGGYGSEMYLAVPSYNPDPRICLCPYRESM